MADRTSDSLGISNGNALAPEDTERLLLPRRAARTSGSFVKEVERRLVEAPTILLGNGNERVALGMDELVPTVNLFVGTGIGGRSWCRFRCVDSVQIDLGFKRKLKTLGKRRGWGGPVPQRLFQFRQTPPLRFTAAILSSSASTLP